MLILLDVVVGISFVYLLLALICTAVNEWIAGALSLRARMLEKGIRQLLGPGAENFYQHPLIQGLSAPGKRPSYIPAQFFSSAVMHLLNERESSTTGTAASPTRSVQQAVAAIKSKQAPADAVAADAAALEEWFNNAMERVTGWYKRQMQILTFATAVAVTLVMNADTLRVITVLWRTPALRASLVEQAGLRVQGPQAVAATYPDVNTPVPAGDEEASAEDLGIKPASADERAMLDQLVGWSSEFRRLNQHVCAALTGERTRACGDESKPADCQQVLARIAAETRCSVEGAGLVATDVTPGGAFLSGSIFPIAGGHLFGWLLTVAAVSLGAPFWFDTLKRFVNIRSAGPSPEEKKK